ncbi:MAG: GIY-YIG nuclease family protein [Leptolyngbyaceae cyanobacterium SM1_1_3]|nr:GIY-YIG nuclease family protein [Leptolyngbyaceae cyanobacterium SM1_1_3]NJN02304.1 GIY-YIG nuclease family protein [Leptolyngbyaceae cyanobacterium RM1_1_2]
MTSEQPSLLSYAAEQAARLSSYANIHPGSAMSLAELQGWKQRVFRFQQQVQQTAAPVQIGLFESAAIAAPSDSLDPFSLPPQNIEFWRWQFEDVGVAALYFVVDAELPILLYVGETMKSNQRWKGVHDCKRYLLNYVSLHNRLRLVHAVNIGFWCEAPGDSKARQQLERALIYQWRSPFNKENWQHWATPFVGEK